MKTADSIMYVIIPAYNEAGRIGPVIQRIPTRITAGGRRFSVKVLVVDDASHDDTSLEAKQAGATVLRHIINIGAGGATRTGMKYVLLSAEPVAYAVTIDADGQHSSADVERIIKYAVKHKASFIVGNRLHAANKRDMPLHRTVGNRGLSFISRTLFGVTVKDTQSGLRLLDRQALQAVSNYSIDRYGFCTEMLWLARRAGIEVLDMPISVTYSEQTLAKGQSNWGVFNLVLDLLWIRISK